VPFTSRFLLKDPEGRRYRLSPQINGVTPMVRFFDSLSVVHYSGPMLEENHYYPFGLTMAGISDKAIKSQYAENKYRANGGDELHNKEFSDGSGLEEYDAFFRMYDPPIGRFWQIDPLPEFDFDFSPYSFANNNPISFNDPHGDTVTSADVKPMPAAIVVGHKADCKTCSPRSVQADPPPAQGSAVASGPTPGKDPQTKQQEPTVTPLVSGSAKSSVTVTSSGSNTSYFDQAIKYEGVPYVSGRAKPGGFDCSGLICMVTGDPTHAWSTHSPGPPPGHWTKVQASHESYKKFIEDVKKGDLFFWRGHHVAFYAGNEQTFGAKDEGKKSGFSRKDDVYIELKTYWIESTKPGRGFPEVYRQY
jgi:RHS repeat-associated protein